MHALFFAFLRYQAPPITSPLTTEDGDKSIETTDFDTTILVPWLPRSNSLSNKGVGGVVLRYFLWQLGLCALSVIRYFCCHPPYCPGFDWFPRLRKLWVVFMHLKTIEGAECAPNVRTSLTLPWCLIYWFGASSPVGSAASSLYRDDHYFSASSSRSQRGHFLSNRLGCSRK